MLNNPLFYNEPSLVICVSGIEMYRFYLNLNFNRFKPSTDRSNAVFLLWIIYIVSVLFLLCFRARLFIDAFWSPAGKGLTSCLSFVMSKVWSCHFPIGILGQMWCLILSIPDLCPLSYCKTLIHLSLASFLWDIGKQCRPRSDARTRRLIRVFTVCLQNLY